MAGQNDKPKNFPRFKSRHFGHPDFPWPGFLSAPPEQSAERCLAYYPQVAAEGRGLDPEYTEWFARMLEATAPTGLIAAACYWEAPPGYMYVSHGPAGIDSFPLPPPGRAREARPSATLTSKFLRGLGKLPRWRGRSR